MASALVARDRLSVAISHDRSVRAIEARVADFITTKETELTQRNEQLRVLARARSHPPISQRQCDRRD
ncbi:hypothetical protein [Xanthomonas arboricola]|uniref:hypothetical protein n=1 Tax=Xanthomonas arboricola TaxID=56448 RepID=UPI001EE87E97|nr:hypothetical protein [Xanthomonas arboricola]